MRGEHEVVNDVISRVEYSGVFPHRRIPPTNTTRYMDYTHTNFGTTFIHTNMLVAALVLLLLNTLSYFAAGSAVKVEKSGASLREKQLPSVISALDVRFAKLREMATDYPSALLPHSRLGYKFLHVPNTPGNRVLSNTKMSFLEAGICGDTKTEAEKSAGFTFSHYREGVISNTCIVCNNTAVAEVNSCKYNVERPNQELPGVSIQFVTYTDDYCSTGETLIGKSHIDDIGVCTDSDEGSFELQYRENLDDLSQLGSGLLYTEWQYEISKSERCSNPTAYIDIGIYKDTCIALDGEEKVKIGIHDCSDNKIRFSEYKNSETCAGTADKTETKDVGQCDVLDDDDSSDDDDDDFRAWEGHDDYTGGYTILNAYNATYQCFSLESAPPSSPKKSSSSGMDKETTAWVVVGVVVPIVAILGAVAGYFYFKKGQAGLAEQEMASSRYSTHERDVAASMTENL